MGNPNKRKFVNALVKEYIEACTVLTRELSNFPVKDYFSLSEPLPLKKLLKEKNLNLPFEKPMSKILGALLAAYRDYDSNNGDKVLFELAEQINELLAIKEFSKVQFISAKESTTIDHPQAVNIIKIALRDFLADMGDPIKIKRSARRKNNYLYYLIRGFYPFYMDLKRSNKNISKSELYRFINDVLFSAGINLEEEYADDPIEVIRLAFTKIKKEGIDLE